MALEALRELEKEESRNSFSSGQEDDGSSTSFDHLRESDPLYHPPKNRRFDAHSKDEGLLRQADAGSAQAWHNAPISTPNRRGSIWSIPWLERYIPLSKLEDNHYVRMSKRYRPKHFVRRIRRRLGLTVPGRVFGFVALTLGAIAVFAALSAGAYFVTKGTRDGQSPSVYPSPPGGTTNEWAESYRKAREMVGMMTLAEKVNVTTGTGWMMNHCVGNTGVALHAGFPPLCLQDGPIATRFTDHITAGPAGITAGATWNKDLLYRRGRLQGIEARNKGVNVVLGPSVGPLGRMPAGGRNWEGFGSDPVLQGIAGALTIKGIQDEGAMATIKHFVGNEQEHYRQALEWGLPEAISSTIDDRTLHEVYGWPFQDAVKAGVASAMCSYNQVNNSYACQNSKLLNGILKDEWGFQGFVQSDWLAQRSGVASALAGLDLSMPGDGEHWANGKPFWGHKLTEAILNGTVPIERLNDMATRIVAAWYQVGQDDEEKWPRPPPLGDGGPNFSSWTDDEYGPAHAGSSSDDSRDKVNYYVNATEGGGFSHSSLARTIAAEGIVMLKNEKEVLPLSRSGWPQAYESRYGGSKARYRIAVIGEDSRASAAGPNGCVDRGCNMGTLAMGWGSGSVEFPYLVTPLEALEKAFPDGEVEISSYPNNTLPSHQKDDDRIYEQDLCIVFVNADAGEGYLSYEHIRGDRNNLDLQHNGNELILDVAAHCGSRNQRNKDRLGISDIASRSPLSDTIVVIHNVGPVLVEPFIDIPEVRAVLLANLPGQESGNSLVDVLLGEVNPSGHLPYTIGRYMSSYGDGSHILYYPNSLPPQQTFSDGLFIDYRHFDSEDDRHSGTSQSSVRYPFGHGLSYTTFSLHNIIANATIPQPPPLPPPRPRADTSPPKYPIAIPPASEAVWPPGLRRLKKYIYPYLSQEEADRARTPDDSTPKSPYPSGVPEVPYTPSPAGGAQGGHPALWETVAVVSADVVNEGNRDGQAVVQLYVRFPQDVTEPVDDVGLEGREQGQESDAKLANRAASGKEEAIVFPVRVLRGFEKVMTSARSDTDGSETPRSGEQTEVTKAAARVVADARLNPRDVVTERVTFNLTRRDLSYWSVRRQNWVLPRGAFEIELGFSSRDLRGSVRLW